MTLQRIVVALETLFRHLGDVLFPQNELILRLENLDSEDLTNCAKSREDAAFNAVFSYKDPVIRNLLWALKYGGSEKCGRILGQSLAENILEDLSEELVFGRDERLIVVPIPISEKRLEERGYNQTEIIATEITAAWPQYFELHFDRLLKIKETEKQSHSRTKSERLKNLQNAYRAEDVNGRTVIVIDDVTTTGATFKEATRALRAAGAKKVMCYAVAH